MTVYTCSYHLEKWTTPCIEMGVMAARILLDRVENPKLPPITVYLNSRVQLRQSTIPPKKS